MGCGSSIDADGGAGAASAAHRNLHQDAALRSWRSSMHALAKNRAPSTAAQSSAGRDTSDNCSIPSMRNSLNGRNRRVLRTLDETPADREHRLFEDAERAMIEAELFSDGSTVSGGEPGATSLAFDRAKRVLAARVSHGITGDPFQFDPDPTPEDREATNRVLEWFHINDDAGVPVVFGTPGLGLAGRTSGGPLSPQTSTLRSPHTPGLPSSAPSNPNTTNSTNNATAIAGRRGSESQTVPHLASHARTSANYTPHTSTATATNRYVVSLDAEPSEGEMNARQTGSGDLTGAEYGSDGAPRVASMRPRPIELPRSQNQQRQSSAPAELLTPDEYGLLPPQRTVNKPATNPGFSEDDDQSSAAGSMTNTPRSVISLDGPHGSPLRGAAPTRAKLTPYLNCYFGARTLQLRLIERMATGLRFPLQECTLAAHDRIIETTWDRLQRPHRNHHR